MLTCSPKSKGSDFAGLEFCIWDGLPGNPGAISSWNKLPVEDAGGRVREVSMFDGMWYCACNNL
jgi:hypothetical protein